MVKIKKYMFICVLLIVGVFSLVGCTQETIEILRVDSIELNETYKVLGVGESEVLLATVFPYNANNQNIIWTTDNEQIVQVNNGIVTAVGTGNTKVYAISEDGNYADFCYLDVIN